MNHHLTRFVLFALFLFKSFPISAFGANWFPDSSDAMDAMLKSKDAQFDNLSVEYQHVENEQVHPFAEWLELSAKVQPGQPQPPMPTDSSVVARQILGLKRLTIRGSEVTFDVMWKHDSTGKELPESSQYFVKVSNAAGTEQDLVTAGDVKIHHSTSSAPKPNGLLQEDRMFAEFCLGFGYGKRIVSIESVDIQDDVAIVNATMRLWSDDKTHARLRLDRNLVVRDALLDANSHGDETRIEVQTSGDFNAPSGRELARTGSFKRTAISAFENGARHPLGYVSQDFSVSVSSIKFDLNSSKYEELAKIDASIATHALMDGNPVLKLPKRFESPAWLRWFLIANVLAVIAVSFGLLFLKRRSTEGTP